LTIFHFQTHNHAKTFYFGIYTIVHLWILIF